MLRIILNRRRFTVLFYFSPLFPTDSFYSLLFCFSPSLLPSFLSFSAVEILRDRFYHFPIESILVPSSFSGNTSWKSSGPVTIACL